MQKKSAQYLKGKAAGSVAVALLGMSLTTATLGGRTREQEPTGENKRTLTRATENFYCNTKALTAEERAKHELLTKKLLAKRKATLETEKGYEFQYSPEDVRVQEVADWVAAESKCCPFFDFHIDLEEKGTLVCLRLTGTDGVKQFIRAEFGLK